MLEEPFFPFFRRDDRAEDQPLGENPPQPRRDHRVACLHLVGALDVFEAGEPLTAALHDPLRAAALDDGVDVAVVIRDQEDPGDIPGGFDHAPHDPLVRHHRQARAEAFIGSLVDDNGLEERGPFVADDPGRHGGIDDRLLQRQEFLQAADLVVHFPVGVDLVLLLGDLLPEIPVFALDAHEEKVAVPDLLDPLRGRKNPSFNRRGRLHDHFFEKADLTRPLQMIGEKNQRGDNADKGNGESLIFSRKKHF